MRSAAVTVRRPGAKMTPASSTRTFDHVGRVNRSANSASRDSRQGGSGSEEMGRRWECCIPSRRIRRAESRQSCKGATNRIDYLIRSSPVCRPSGTLTRMTKPDLTLAQIAAQFTCYNVEKSGGGYMILDRRTSNPVARLRPIPTPIASSYSIGQTSRGGGCTFGNLGRMKLRPSTLARLIGSAQ